MIEITEQGKSGSIYEFQSGALTVGCWMTQPKIAVMCDVVYQEYTADEAEQIALHMLSVVETVRKREGKEKE